MTHADVAPLQRALQQWRQLLGEPAVDAPQAAQARYGVSTIGLERRIAGALRPGSRDHVVAAMGIAAKNGIALYPISTGHNWGYGSANPAQDDCVIVDLSGLTAISSFDRELGLVTVEPGVTQGQLRDFLDEHAPEFMVPVTGAGPTCSILGNALERGYGITPITDHFAAVTQIEAVLPDGSLYRTPLSLLGGSLVDRAHKWGLGPYLDGLFSQSNFGIVVSMTIALARTPAYMEAFFFGLARDEDLEAGVAAIRDILRELGANIGAVNLMNARRMLSMLEPYPHQQLGEQGILTERALRRLAAGNKVMAWTGVGSIYGPRPVVKAVRAQIRKRLRGIGRRMLFMSPSAVGRYQRLLRALPGTIGGPLRRQLSKVDLTLRVLAGEPNELALPLAYWRAGVAVPQDRALDPARDGCGLLWHAPLVPMVPERVRAYTALTERLCAEHGIEPLITLTSLSHRCFDSTVPILFNRSEPTQEQRAHACRAALLDACLAEGFVPYRIAADQMAAVIDPQQPYWRLVRSIKNAVDPAELIAPGRYCPPQR